MGKKIELDSMKVQRLILGYLCIALAPACVLFGLFGMKTNPDMWYKSVSATFYANSNVIMVGLLATTAIFFFSYRGYDIKDRICSLVQAICCIGSIIFPTELVSSGEQFVGLFDLPMRLSWILHSIFSGILFVALAYNVFFLFTLGNGEPTKQKTMRNIIYRVCGIVIFVCTLCVPLNSMKLIPCPDWLPLTMIVEFLMLSAFGFAYIVKSEAIYKLNDITT